MTETLHGLAERLDLALRDAARRFVEQDHRRAVGDDAREVDDPAAAGRQLADPFATVRAEVHQLDQLGDAPIDVGFAVECGRQVQSRRHRVP